jgi:hypothetical protein
MDFTGQYAQALASLYNQIQNADNNHNVSDEERYGKGNIDLYNRPQYRQPDGSLSTTYSLSFNDGNNEVLVPSIAYGTYGQPELLSPNQAIQRYYDTGEYLGKFKNPNDAGKYAEALHQQQAKIYPNQNTSTQEQYANLLRLAGYTN